mgnify:CR=1 FL=1
MANLRNTTGAPAAARSGETAQEVRDRWSGEISTTDLPPIPTWNEPWTPEDTRFGVPSVTGQMNSQMTENTGGMQMAQMNALLFTGGTETKAALQVVGKGFKENHYQRAGRRYD